MSAALGSPAGLRYISALTACNTPVCNEKVTFDKTPQSAHSPSLMPALDADAGAGHRLWARSADGIDESR